LIAYSDQKLRVFMEAQLGRGGNAEHSPARLNRRGNIVDRQSSIQKRRQEVESRNPRRRGWTVDEEIPNRAIRRGALRPKAEFVGEDALGRLLM